MLGLIVRGAVFDSNVLKCCVKAFQLIFVLFFLRSLLTGIVMTT